VVLAFEDREDAETYAASLSDAEVISGGYEGEASVQGLDVEALVVTSRDADFQVGLVFSGDLVAETDGPSTPFLITGADSRPRVALSITIVPDNCFEGRTAEDFLDPAEDPVWVLIHDEGTADAQFFSMALNGTASVVCFKDEEAAERCSNALRRKGEAAGEARAVLLEELLDRIDDSEMEVCLVDEVVETEIEASAAEADAQPGLIASDGMSDTVLGSLSSAAGETVRAKLELLYDTADDADESDAPDGQR